MLRRFLPFVALLAVSFAFAPTRMTVAETAAAYFVNRNAQPDGDHEVHREGCPHPPAPKNRFYLGDFSSCEAAVRKAREHYAQADGCYHCARECDTG